jgi:hypothetical protein
MITPSDFKTGCLLCSKKNGKVHSWSPRNPGRKSPDEVDAREKPFPHTAGFLHARNGPGYPRQQPATDRHCGGFQCAVHFVGSSYDARHNNLRHSCQGVDLLPSYHPLSQSRAKFNGQLTSASPAAR